MAADLLEQEGIPSVVQSPEGMWMGPLPEGATVRVRQDQVEQARTILIEAGLIRPT